MKASTLEALYQFHMNDLYRYLLKLSGHPETAEDLVQDTFIKAYEHLESYQGEGVRPWLFRVAHNAYIDWYRRRKREVLTNPESLNDLNRLTRPDPEQELLLKEHLSGRLQAIDLLSARGRQVLLLRDYFDFTYQEIADILGLSLNNVKLTLYRARQKMREVDANEL